MCLSEFMSSLWLEIQSRCIYIADSISELNGDVHCARCMKKLSLIRSLFVKLLSGARKNAAFHDSETHVTTCESVTYQGV